MSNAAMVLSYGFVYHDHPNDFTHINCFLEEDKMDWIEKVFGSEQYHRLEIRKKDSLPWELLIMKRIECLTEDGK